MIPAEAWPPECEDLAEGPSITQNRTDCQDLKPSVYGFLDECRHPQEHFIMVHGLMQESGMLRSQRLTTLATV